MLHDGSATSMRGKSLTCRPTARNLPVYDQVEDAAKKEELAGKSKTCRASERHSHWVGGAIQ